MKKYTLILLSIVPFITIIFFPIPFSKEPLKVNPKANLRKRINTLVTKKPKLIENKKSFDKIVTRLEKYDSFEKVISSSLQEEIDKSLNQPLKNIRIVLNTTDNTKELLDRIERYGGRVLRKRPKFIAVEVPVYKIEQMIEENSGIKYARLPLKYYPQSEVSEGVDLTRANTFHEIFYKGAGVKVAVVDVGFKGLTEAIADGELPDGLITQDFSGKGLEREYYHGTACAEIVHDMAPDAELHLLKLGDEIDTYEIIDYCIDNGIDIVSLSVGTFGTGPGDGTGPLDEAFDELREAGILVVASVGNYAIDSYEVEGILLTFGYHWEGFFNDTDGDTYHEFKNYDSESYYNVIGAFPMWDDDGNPSTSEVTILLRWDDWPVSNIDYNMYLYEYDYENPAIGTLVASSTTYQTGTQEPVEYISLDIPDYETEGCFYALEIKRTDVLTPTGTKLEVYLGGTSAFVPFMHINGTFNSNVIATSTSSIIEPADAESVLAVGAIDFKNWSTGPQENFSSQGPTNDWNDSSSIIKPDIMGPDGVSTYTYGDSNFYGTSAAAPHVAGIAALILSFYPEMNPDQIQAYLEESAMYMWASGKNNLYGWGRVIAALPSFPIVKSYQKISDTDGNFTGTLDIYDYFGSSVASIGDLNGDGIRDLAVGAEWDDDGGPNNGDLWPNKGAVWILFLNSDGTVESHQKISETDGNFTGTLDYGDSFGSSIASVGDLNGDGIADLAVGALLDDDGGSDQGAVWILFLNSDGTVKFHQKISEIDGNFTGILDEADNFGSSIASIGDLNGDGIGDLAVGALLDDDGGSDQGAVWILFLNSDGTVKFHQKISDTDGNFTGTLDEGNLFGTSAASIGDLNEDGIADLAVGATGDDEGSESGVDQGAVWILFLNSDGTVKSHQRISETDGNFTGTLDAWDYFGSSVASIGDLNGDGIVDLTVGADCDDDGGNTKGAVWILFLNSDGTVKFHQKISDTDGNFTGTLDEGDQFGTSVSSMSDLNGDGFVDLIVGADYDDDGGDRNGAVWILFLDPNAIDTEYDGMPNRWEIDYGLNPNINDADGDLDNDDLININEFRIGTNPGVSDTDSDEMPDGWEVDYNLDPLFNDSNEDADGDGFENILEYQKKTDPQDAESHPSRGMPWLPLLLEGD